MNQRKAFSLVKVIDVSGSATVKFNNGDIIEDVIAVASDISGSKNVTLSIGEDNVLVLSLTANGTPVMDKALKVLIGETKDLTITATGATKVIIKFYNTLELFTNTSYTALTE